MDLGTALVTLGAVILGWFLASIWQWWLTKKENEKEHYYRAIEKTEEIVDQCSGLSDRLYQFFKNCMHLANHNESLPPDAIPDFITEFQIRVGKVHVTERLYFPGIEFEAVRITQGVDDLMDNVREMFQIRQRLQVGVSMDQTEYDRLNASNFQRLNVIVHEIELQGTMMQVSLRKTATRLGLLPQPVTVDRTKLEAAHGSPTRGRTSHEI